MKLAEEKLVLLQIFGGEPFRIQYNLSSCRLYPIGRKGEAMKATFISGALIILLAVAGCGGNSIIHTGGPTGPFLFMVGQTSDNLHLPALTAARLRLWHRFPPATLLQQW
jgi:hypothetical protein